MCQDEIVLILSALNPGESLQQYKQSIFKEVIFMKSLFLTLSFTIALIGSLLSNKTLAKGGMSGGQGSTAFALQKIQTEHPTMSKEEVLVQAFKQAAGKPIDLHFNLSENDSKEVAWILNSQKLSYYGSLIFGTIELRGGKGEGIAVYRDLYDEGPIFSNEITYSNYSVSFKMFPLLKGDYKISAYNANEGIKLKSGSGLLEIRQLDKDVVLIGFYGNGNENNVCHYSNAKPISGLCGVVSFFTRN